MLLLHFQVPARPRREDRRGARGSGAGSSPAAARSSRVLPLPRQPQHRAGGNRRTVARLSGGPGRRQSPRTRRGPARSPRRQAARALPTAPGAAHGCSDLLGRGQRGSFGRAGLLLPDEALGPQLCVESSSWALMLDPPPPDNYLSSLR